MAAPGKAVDRAIGVLVAACASALLVALGARAGASFTTFLRLAYDEHIRGGGAKRRSSPDRQEAEGDAYFEYAYGARSAAAAAAEARARARARARGGGEAGGEEEGAVLVLHLGSCHCGGLAFEVEAPEHLVAIEGPSKVRAVPLVVVFLSGGGAERPVLRGVNGLWRSVPYYCYSVCWGSGIGVMR